MSLDLNQIYCNHYLKNKTLQGYCKNPQFESFPYPPHTVLTSFHIKDSIHYNALITNNYKHYEEYIYTTNQEEHSVENFLSLKRDFDVNKMKNIIVLYNFEKKRYFIEDGVHRLSILLYKKLINHKVPIKYLDIRQNNCFYFIIYEHGIEHCNAICDEIEKSKLRIDEKIHLELPSNKFTDFIFEIYPDNNKDHILNKNKYIINSSKKKEHVRTIILLVSIDKWEPMSRYKCKEIEMVKRKIRNLYNPKFKDINQQIRPLNKGVSHNHVIHSIDLPNEFFPIYNVIDKYSKYIMLDLILFFKDMKNYTIIKKDPNFPFFTIGKDDVDVLCLDIKKTVTHIKNILTEKYSKYTYRFNNNNNQLDVLFGNKFIFKFDLYDSLTNMYKPYDIPKNLTKEVIENSISENNIKFPLLKDELMIRQLEYNKWIKQRPDKKKHLDFIKSHPNVKYTIFKVKT